MLYPSKTFKVNPFYRMLYETIFDVVNQDKSPLLKALLKESFGNQKTLSLDQFDFNELIETMIINLEKELSNFDYEDIQLKINIHPRTVAIRKEFHKAKRKSMLTNISFRISKDTVQKIHKLKQNTLGEVIELAIGLFILSCDDLIFDLILLSVKHQDAN